MSIQAKKYASERTTLSLAPMFGYKEYRISKSQSRTFGQGGLGMSIVTNFGKIERTYHLPFQGGSRMTCVNEKIPPMKKFTSVTNYSICKARKH